ncbi:MAG: hypothetical protein QM622_02730 [Microbacterium sp.]
MLTATVYGTSTSATDTHQLIVEGQAAQPEVDEQSAPDLTADALRQEEPDLSDAEISEIQERYAADSAFLTLRDAVAERESGNYVSAGYATALTGFPDSDFAVYLLFKGSAGRGHDCGHPGCVAVPGRGDLGTAVHG